MKYKIVTVQQDGQDVPVIQCVYSEEKGRYIPLVDDEGDPNVPDKIDAIGLYSEILPKTRDDAKKQRELAEKLQAEKQSITEQLEKYVLNREGDKISYLDPDESKRAIEALQKLGDGDLDNEQAKSKLDQVKKEHEAKYKALSDSSETHKEKLNTQISSLEELIKQMLLAHAFEQSFKNEDGFLVDKRLSPDMAYQAFQKHFNVKSPLEFLESDKLPLGIDYFKLLKKWPITATLNNAVLINGDGNEANVNEALPKIWADWEYKDMYTPGTNSGGIGQTSSMNSFPNQSNLSIEERARQSLKSRRSQY